MATTQLPTFAPGDTVSFCDDEATVIADYGTTITVKRRTGPTSYDVMSWYKVFQGEPVKLVTPTYVKQK